MLSCLSRYFFIVTTTETATANDSLTTEIPVTAGNYILYPLFTIYCLLKIEVLLLNIFTRICLQIRNPLLGNRQPIHGYDDGVAYVYYGYLQGKDSSQETGN